MKTLHFEHLPDFDSVDNTTEQEQIELTRLENNKVDTASDSAREELARVREENNYAVGKYKWENQDELARIRLGRILSMHEFLFMLRRINPTFHYNDWSKRGLRGLNYYPRGTNAEPKYTGVSVQNGAAPEFESIYIDEHGLPGRSRFRGWRTVLLALIKQNIITEAQAEAVFGKPEGNESARYRKELWEFRNSRNWNGNG